MKDVSIHTSDLVTSLIYTQKHHIMLPNVDLKQYYSTFVHVEILERMTQFLLQFRKSNSPLQ